MKEKLEKARVDLEQQKTILEQQFQQVLGALAVLKQLEEDYETEEPKDVVKKK